VIVPLEYATGGLVPPDWFIHDLMKFLKQQYYIGVLSAAGLHGASHQQAQEYQVVVPTPERSIRTPNLNIRFFLKKNMKHSPAEQIKSYTGYITVSSPAVTALDLVRFAPKIGGLDAVLTVISELVEKITPEDLLKAVKQEQERSQIQRLGWLLERAKRPELADGIAKWLAKHKTTKTRLDVSASIKGFRKDTRFNVIVNAQPQSET
jgi:predicted transcriptional regulator of viral defense system